MTMKLSNKCLSFSRRPSLSPLLMLTAAAAVVVSASNVGGCSALIVPPSVVHTACGFVAGSAGAIAAYPIDFVKSQLQTEEGRAKYNGGVEAAVDIVKHEPGGVFALYRGVGVNIVGIAPEKTIKLSVNNAVRTAIRAHFQGTLPFFGEVVAGGFAGMTQVSVTNPLEVVKVRMQTSEMTLKEVLGQLKSFGDFYQGAGACVARDVMFSAILFPLYAHAKVAMAAFFMTHAASLATGGDDTALMFWANMVAGSIAAAPAAALSTPADVIKTRLQQAREEQIEIMPMDSTGLDEDDLNELCLATVTVAPDGSATAGPTNCNTPFMETLQSIVHDEGAEVLMSGWLERVVRSVPQFGVTLAVFDVLNTIAIQHGWMAAEALA